MILASFIDPAGDGFDAVDIGTLLGVLLALGAVFLGSRRAIRSTRDWVTTTLKEMIRDEIAVGRAGTAKDVAALTAPISKDGNGGRSLADANRKLDLIAEHLELMIPVNLKADK